MNRACKGQDLGLIIADIWKEWLKINILIKHLPALSIRLVIQDSDALTFEYKKLVKQQQRYKSNN